MRHFLLINLLLTLMFYPVIVPAQDLSKSGFPLSFILKYTNDPAAEQKNTSVILKEIAYDAVLDLNRTCLKTSLNIECRISPADDDNFNIDLFTSALSLKGNTVIRGFDLSTSLVPDLISLSFYQVRKADTMVLHSGRWKYIPFTGNGILCSTVIRKWNPVTDTIILKIEDLAFTDSVRNSFFEKINLVNDYYASSAILDSLGLILQNENINSCNDLPLAFIRIQEAWKVAELMRGRNFEERLDLQNYDPKDLRRRITDLYKLSRSLAMTFTDKLDTITGINKNDPDKDPAVIFVNHFHRYIRWSLLVNSRNGKIYDDYLNTYFDTNVFDKDRDVIIKLFSRMKPPFTTGDIDSAWAGSVCRAFEERELQMITGSRHAEAVRLAGVEELFMKFYGFRNKTDLEKMKISAYNGIYESYLGIAETSMIHGKYVMAENYLSRAQEFRKVQPSLVTSDSLLNVVSRKLMTTKLSFCDSLAVHEEYDDAIGCYESIGTIYDGMTSEVVKREITRKTDFCYFNKYRLAGFGYLENQNLTEAGKYFHMACELQQTNGYPADTILDSLCNATFPFYLISLLRSREELIWTGQIEAARYVADSVSAVAPPGSSYNIPQLTAYIDRYRKKIHDKECYELTDNFEILSLRGDRNYELGNFLRGNMLTDSALIAARAHPACGLDTISLAEKVKKYAAPALYQKQMKDMSALVSMNEFEKAVDLYVSNEQLFKEYHLETFGLKCEGLYDFINNRNIPVLSVEALSHFIEASQFREAFRYLKLLRNQDYPSKNTVFYQKEVARKFAAEDFKAGADPSAMASAYVASDSWFSAFRTAYLYQWNVIKNTGSSSD